MKAFKGPYEPPRCHQGGFGGNLGELLLTSPPELPLQLRDPRDDQTCLKSCVLFFEITYKHIIDTTTTTTIIVIIIIIPSLRTVRRAGLQSADEPWVDELMS